MSRKCTRVDEFCKGNQERKLSEQIRQICSRNGAVAGKTSPPVTVRDVTVMRIPGRANVFGNEVVVGEGCRAIHELALGRVPVAVDAKPFTWLHEKI